VSDSPSSKSASSPTSSADHVTQLARRLAALPALAMRRAVLRETLTALDAAAAARLCGEIVRRGRDGAPWDGALLALNAILDGDDLFYDQAAAIYAAARDAGDEVLLRLMLSGGPARGATDTEIPSVPVIPGKTLTLGERKSLARGRVARERLDRLLHDRDPQVIAILLANPAVTELDVVRMAARRPTTPEAQRAIFASERFIVRYEVKRALAFNPYSPSELAARLVPHLTRVDLKALAMDGAVSEQVREAARETLREIP